jgi:hypothetical protein
VVEPVSEAPIKRMRQLSAFFVLLGLLRDVYLPPLQNKVDQISREREKTTCFTLIEPWNALAPSNASTTRTPSDALKER